MSSILLNVASAHWLNIRGDSFLKNTANQLPLPSCSEVAAASCSSLASRPSSGEEFGRSFDHLVRFGHDFCGTTSTSWSLIYVTWSTNGPWRSSRWCPLSASQQIMWDSGNMSCLLPLYLLQSLWPGVGRRFARHVVGHSGLAFAAAASNFKLNDASSPRRIGCCHICDPPKHNNNGFELVSGTRNGADE